MLCRKPFVMGTAAHACGQCMPCRYNRRRLWQHRIMQEAKLHAVNCFVTLTYADGSLPTDLNGTRGATSHTGGTLLPKDTQDWLKRLRKMIQPLRVRYYLVGEYGDENFRPHYHAALFGWGACDNLLRSRQETCSCTACDVVAKSWGKGRTDLRSLDSGLAQYLCGGYITKKMTRFDDVRLTGRHPEFARMSLAPGIGADVMWDIASSLLSFSHLQGDVPSSLEIGGKKYPLGRYLRKKLREFMGRDPKAPPNEKLIEEVRAVFESKVLTGEYASLASALSAQSDQHLASIEAKNAIFKRGRHL